MQVKKEFKELIPRLTEEEYSQLEANIIKDGCRDPLVVWNDTLIDGHNRYEICTKNNIKYKTVEKKFEDEDDVINWILLNQLGRRNLTDLQRKDIRGKLYNRSKQSVGGQLPKGVAHNDTPLSTAQKIAIK